MYTNLIKSYLINWKHIKDLRQKYHIWFMEYCRRSGLSTRTLASIEQSTSRVVKDDTMTKIMRGFNFTRQGLRKKLLPVDKVAEGSFSVSNPLLVETKQPSTKLTIYLSKATHKGVQAYAQQYWCSKNQAVIRVLKNEFHIIEEKLIYNPGVTSFQTIGNSGV